jgi:hypothetical protein
VHLHQNSTLLNIRRYTFLTEFWKNFKGFRQLKSRIGKNAKFLIKFQGNSNLKINFILTQEQEIELVEKCLRLKVRGYNLQGIKWFCENYVEGIYHERKIEKSGNRTQVTRSWSSRVTTTPTSHITGQNM